MKLPILRRPAVLLAAALAVPAALAIPAAARAQGDPVAPPTQTADEYNDRYEQERLEKEREEQEARRGQWTPPTARRGEGIQVQGVPETELTAVLHQLDVEHGELVVRLRFYNDGAEPARLKIDPAAAYESFFVQVGREKLFILRDDDGDLDAKKPLDVELRPGKMESWWAKFPAPAAGTETFDLAIPPAATFRSVALED